MQNNIQSIKRNSLRILLLSNNMENFSDVLNKVKEIHEKEVQELQAKMTELTMERCRDTRRIDELFAKNHLLREQQKALNENVKVLENRLRAGLCDRCTVTQELAKKKQQEYEESHFHSLQLISSLTNELRGLKEENTSLRKELGKLQNLETENQRVVSPEKDSCSDLSPENATISTEKPPSKEKEKYEDISFPQPAEEKSFGPGNSPAARCSPARTVQDMCLFDIVCMNPQRISNKLHGTIAVVKPGGKSCLSETSPQARTSPSGIHCHSNHDKQLRGNSPDSCEITSCHEILQQGSREEQLRLLSQHFSQGRFSLQSAGISAERVLNHVPKSREIEVVRRRSLNELEEHSAVLELQGAVMYRSERRRHSIAEQRERLQYFLARQHEQLKQRARAETFRNQIVDRTSQEGKDQSLPWTLWANENKHKREWSENEWEGKSSVLTSTKKSESNEKQEASSSPLLDKPLDLSDHGQIREAGFRRRQHKLSPSSRESPASPQNVTGPNALQKGDHESLFLESSQLHAGSPINRDTEALQLRAQDAENFVPVLEVSLSPPGDSPKYNPAGDPGIQVMVSIKRQKQEMQELEVNDGEESRKEGADEPDTSDSETTGPETEQNQRGQDREYLCIKGKAQHSKRKRGLNHWAKGKGNKKVKAAQTPIEGTMEDEKEANNSDSCGEDFLGKT